MWKDIQDILREKSKIESSTIFCRNRRQNRTLQKHKKLKKQSPRRERVKVQNVLDRDVREKEKEASHYLFF